MRRTLFTFLTVLVSAALITGCAVSPGRAQYTAHTTHRVSAGDASNSDVAFAFGLDGLGRQDRAFAQGNE